MSLMILHSLVEKILISFWIRKLTISNKKVWKSFMCPQWTYGDFYGNWDLHDLGVVVTSNLSFNKLSLFLSICSPHFNLRATGKPFHLNHLEIKKK